MMSEPVDFQTARKKRAADQWRHCLLLQKDGEPKRSLANTLAVLQAHPNWKNVIAFNSFTETVMKKAPPPVRPGDGKGAMGEWTEEDSTRTAAWFASNVGFEPTPQMVDSAVAVAAEVNAFHPVREYLSELTWDGQERLPSLLCSYFGAKPDRYTGEVGKRWMISAVARVFRPGVQVDSMIVLESPQGRGKSTAMEALAGKPWFSDTGINLRDKDAFQSIRGKWIYEFGELDAFKGGEVTRIKNFVSARVDHYRPSYARRARDFRRQVIFVGTTNENEYLIDKTGNRRFWPVKCGDIDVEGIRRDRDQLWAEAVRLFKDNHPWHLDSKELVAMAQEEQASREVGDDWDTLIAKWLDDPVRKARLEEGTTTAEVLTGALSLQAKDMTPSATTRAGGALRRLGYSPRQVRKEDGTRPRLYFPRGCDGL